jgi:predicted Zn-dependent protease
VSAGEGSAGMRGREAQAGEAVAAHVLELVRGRAASAEAESVVHTGVSALTRFANGAIHQNVAEDVSHVALRLALDGRVAAAALDGPADREHLERLVEGVFAAAAVSPVDPDWPGLAGPDAAPDVDHWDDATAAATPDERAEGVAAFVVAAGGLVTAGALSTDARHISFANNAGQALTGRMTWATIDGIARTPTSDGVARQSSATFGLLDTRAAGDTAARKARDAANATDLAPGRHEVVLEPACVANLIGFLVGYGFGGRAVEEGRSFVRLGEQQLDPAFSLRDDVTHPGMIGVGFDPEGTPRRPLDLVRAGVPAAILHDRRTAARAGTTSTGAGVLGANPWGVVPACGVVTPGDASLDALVATVERGILVTDFWYTRVLDPRTVVVTGLTRNGVWLIEDGRVGRAVTNLRFTQSFPEALAPGTVLGVGRDLALFPDEDEGALLVPALRLGSWNFSGGARG